MYEVWYTLYEESQEGCGASPISSTIVHHRPKWCPPKVEFDWTSPKIKTGNWLKMRCKETCFMTHLPLDEVCAEHWMPSEFPQVEGLLNPLIYVPCSSFCRRDTLDIFRYCLLLWLTRMPLLHTHVLYYADISSNCHLSVYGGIAWSIHLSSDQNPGYLAYIVWLHYLVLFGF